MSFRTALLIAVSLCALAITSTSRADAPPQAASPAPEGALLAKVADLERDWRSARATLLADGFSQEIRLRAMREFLAKHDYDNAHSASARAVLAKLEAGQTVTKKDLRRLEDVERGFTPERYRTKPEWMSLDATAGVYGSGVRFTFFTLRCEHFYWNMVHGVFTAGWLGMGIHGGSGIGIPFPLDASGRREIRIGAGVEGGLLEVWSQYGDETCRTGGKIWKLVEDEYGNVTWQEVPSEECGDGEYYFVGALPYAEILYSHQLRPHFGWEVGLSVYLMPPSMTKRHVSAETEDGTPSWTQSDVWLAPNAFLFFGLTI